MGGRYGAVRVEEMPVVCFHIELHRVHAWGWRVQPLPVIHSTTQCLGADHPEGFCGPCTVRVSCCVRQRLEGISLCGDPTRANSYGLSLCVPWRSQESGKRKRKDRASGDDRGGEERDKSMFQVNMHMCHRYSKGGM